MKTSKYIYFMLGIIIASLGWQWYVNNVTACAFAQGVKLMSRNTYFVDEFGNKKIIGTNHILIISEDDYKACALVGKVL